MEFKKKGNQTNFSIGIFKVKIFNQENIVKTIETKLNPQQVGLVFFGNHTVQLCANGSQQTIVKENNRFSALSFYTKDNLSFKFSSTESHAEIIIISVHFRHLRHLDIEDFGRIAELMRVVNKSAIQFCFGPNFLLSMAIQANLKQMFNSVYSGFSGQMLVKSQVMEIIAHFFGDVLNRRQEQIADSDRLQLIEAKEIMLNNLSDPPNIESLAWQIGMSSTKLKKLFKEYYGASVYKYFQEFKLNKAYSILLESSLNIKEVAWEVGYDSQGSFSNAFTQRFGVRPSEIKRGSTA